jgi:large subunit ribosomal protein L4
MLSALGLQEQSVLLVVAEKTVPVWKSTNNLPEVKTMLSGYINVRDLLSQDVLLVTQDAVAHIEDWLSADLAIEVDDAQAAEEAEA